MRRILVALLLLALAAAATWTVWHWERDAKNGTDPWRAVPTHSAVVLVFPDVWDSWDRFTHTSQLWGAFEKLPAVGATGQLMARTLLRMDQDAALRATLEDTPALVALMRRSAGSVGSLFILAPRLQGSTIPSSLTDVLGVDPAGLAALLQGAVIVAHPDTALPPISLCLREGLLLLTSDEGVMDEALLQLGSGTSISEDPVLAQAMATLGAGADAHVLVHTTRTARLLHTWWRPDAIEHIEPPAGWVALDLRARADAFLLSGLLVPAEEHTMLTAMAAQGTGRPAPWRALPAAVTALDVQWITAPLRWTTDRSWPGETPDPAIVQALLGWVQGSMAIATAMSNESLTRWYYFATDDPQRATEDLQGLCTDAPCDTVSYRGQRITRLPMGGMHERLLGPAYSDMERPWWTVLGDAVLFARESDPLQRAIDSWIDGGALAEDARSNAWTSRIGQEAGRNWWMDVARSRAMLRAGLKPEAAAAFDALDSLWLHLGGLSLQLSPGQRGFHHVFAGLGHAPLDVRETGILWSTAIGAPVERAPDILRNHVNNTREVLVQDTTHRIHLLGSNGKVLWTRQLDGKIMGAVHQVDRYRNNKLQMLFNTAGTLYLIDRNGKDVAGWPIPLRRPATAPLAVFDYDGERDYRVLVPTQDGSIVNIGMDGEAVKGWESPRMAAPVTKSLSHLRMRNRDHLLVVDAQGKVWVLDRRGAERAQAELRLEEGATVRAVLPGMDIQGARIVWSTTDGALWQGTVAGERSMLAPAAEGSAWPVDFGGDGGRAVLHIHGDTLRVTQDGRDMLLRTFGTTLLHDALTIPLGRGATAIAVTFPDMGRVTLLDEVGREIEGFPLPGDVPMRIADLDVDGQPEAITITRDGTVTAHRLPGLGTSGTSQP